MARQNLISLVKCAAFSPPRSSTLRIIIFDMNSLPGTLIAKCDDLLKFIQNVVECEVLSSSVSRRPSRGTQNMSGSC
jgi:hypothetical protein